MKWVIKFDISSDTNWLFLFLRCWAIRMLSMWHDYILLPSPLFVNTPQSWMQGWKMFTQNMINKKLLDGITNSTRTLLISDENMYSNKYYVLSIMCFRSIEVYLGTIFFFWFLNRLENITYLRPNEFEKIPYCPNQLQCVKN